MGCAKTCDRSRKYHGRDVLWSVSKLTQIRGLLSEVGSFGVHMRYSATVTFRSKEGLRDVRGDVGFDNDGRLGWENGLFEFFQVPGLDFEGHSGRVCIYEFFGLAH